MTFAKSQSSLNSHVKCKSIFKNQKLILLIPNSVKSDQLKLSLDYLDTADFEMGGNVLGELDMVKDMFFWSDKCTTKEEQKLADEFEKDLKKLRYKTRVSIWKYIKEVDSSGGSKEKKEDGEEGSLKGPS